MIFHYIKLSWRNILTYKTQSVISIMGLSVGFTAFMLATYWYYWEHNFDTFHPDWKKTYTIVTHNFSEDIKILHQLNKEAAEHFKKYPEIEDITLTDLSLFSPENQNRVWVGMKVQKNFFDFFHHEFIEGTHNGDTFDEKSVILTERMAKRLFGNTSCVGKTFSINDKISFNIAGVIKDYPHHSSFQFEYLLLSPVKYNKAHRLPTYIRIKPNIDIENLKNKIANYRIDKEDNAYNAYSKIHFELRKLPDIHLIKPNLEARFRNITILFVGSALAFISSLMNLLVLFLSRQQVKLRYNELYRMIGASTRGLIAKGITELFVLLLISFIISMAMIEVLFPFYQEYTTIYSEGQIYTHFRQFLLKGDLMQMSVFIFAISGILFLLFSIVPIYLLIRGTKKSTSFVFRDFLVAGQIFIGSLFLVTALAFYLQYQYTSDTDKGIVPDNIWQIDVGYFNASSPEFDSYLSKIKNSPYIDEVTTLTQGIFSSSGIYYGNEVKNISLEEHPERKLQIHLFAIEPNFLTFFNLQMKAGNWFSHQENISKYVTNEVGAKEINLNTDFNKRFHDNSIEKDIQVIGVMKNYHYTSMQHPLQNVFFYIPSKEERQGMFLYTPYIYIKVLPENREKALAFVQQHYNELPNEEIPIDKRFTYLPEIMEELNASDNKMSWIFLVLASICISIAVLGIYSLVALSAEQRKKEIAIRKINGATFHSILKLFLKRYFIIAILSNMLALPLGYLFINKWLENYAYHFDLSIWLFVLVLLITSILVGFSVSKQVGKAMKINEADVLKSS